MTLASPPPQRVRRVLEALLPDDPWCAEYLVELEHEHSERLRSRGRRAADGWYRRRLLSPTVWRFVWLTRRRERRARRAGSGSAGGRGSAGSGGLAAHAVGGSRGAALDGWLQDLRHAGRALLRGWRVAVFIVITLGLGISANAAMFGVADRLLLTGPEHVDEPERLVRLFLRFDESDGVIQSVPWIPYRTASAVLEQEALGERSALFRTADRVVGLGNSARMLRVASVGPGYFELFGLSARAGRLFDPSDPAGAPLAVVSHELWERDLGGSSSAVGSLLQLGDRSYTVVGVAPSGFTGTQLLPVHLWVPIEPEAAPTQNWHILVRLPGAGPVEDARARVAAQANAIHLRTDPGRAFQWARDGTMVALSIDADDSGAPPVEAAIAGLLLGVAALILVIAMANAVSLLLARLTRRRREIAVRLALGSGRLRLARLLLTETLALATIAGIASLPVTYGVGLFLRQVLLPQVAWPGSPLSPGPLLLTAGATLSTGLLVALLPFRHAGRTDVVQDLRSGRGRGAVGASGLQLALAGSQIALSAVLLLGAGLFLRSFLSLRITDLGIDADRAIALELRSVGPRAIPVFEEDELELYRRGLEVLRAHPDVEVATLTLGLPFLRNFGMGIEVPGRDSIPELPGGGPFLSAIDEGYFDVAGTSIVRGRAFTDAEHAGPAPVILVSESMAQALWPGEDPLGRCVRVGTSEQPCSTVVGVAQDVHRVGYREPPSMQYYVPLAPSSRFGGMTLLFRARTSDGASLARIRAALESFDPAVSLAVTTVLSAALADQIRPWYLGASVLGFAAALALLVSLIGVYGVLSYLVEQRRRELGVRIALGATGGGIRALVVRRGLGAAGMGIGAGIALTLLLRRWIDPLLFETRAADPAVLAGVVVLLTLTSVGACLVPARRAARVPPALCLRDE